MNVNTINLSVYYNNMATMFYSGNIFAALKDRQELLLECEIRAILKQVLKREPTETEMIQADAYSAQEHLREIYGNI